MVVSTTTPAINGGVHCPDDSCNHWWYPQRLLQSMVVSPTAAQLLQLLASFQMWCLQPMLQSWWSPDMVTNGSPSCYNLGGGGDFKLVISSNSQWMVPQWPLQLQHNIFLLCELKHCKNKSIVPSKRYIL